MSEVVIDEKNFYEYFKDVKTSKPSKGDVMAAYRAIAELHSGTLKEDIVDALCREPLGAKKAVQLLVKIGQAERREAIGVIKKVCDDLLSGMPRNSVIMKSYEYIFEMFFYTKKEYVPENDNHWRIISLKNLDDYLEQLNNKNEKNESTIKEDKEIHQE